MYTQDAGKQLPALSGVRPHFFTKGYQMKALVIIVITTFIVVIATVAQAQTTTKCVKNWDGSVTCTTTKTSPFGY